MSASRKFAKINYDRFRLRRRRHVILVIAIVIDQAKVIIVVFVIIVAIVETFRYEDGDDSDDYEDKINLKVFFLHSPKNDIPESPRKVTRKVGTSISIEGGSALCQSQNDKTSNIQ